MRLSSFSADTSQVITHRYGSDTVHEDAGFLILAMTGDVLDTCFCLTCVL